MILADMGADVVKVEDPRVGDYLRARSRRGGGGVSGRFLATNRGKRSIALDLKSDAGRAALLAMAVRADVVVESFRPGVLDRLGVGYAALTAANPRIVVCSISGYGGDGPYVDRAGHDLNYIAVAGVLAMGGAAHGAPMLPGVQIADLAGGALWGTTAVLAALMGRERTGAGAHLDISMTEGALALLAAELANMTCGAHPTRGEATLNGGLACYGVYRAGDGRYLAVGALEPKFWMALNTAIGRPATVAELVAPAEQQAKIAAELQAIFATRPAAEWAEICARHDCCVEVVTEVDELAAHPLHRARGVFFDMDGGAGVGTVKQVRTPVAMPALPVRPPPRLGQHTREVLEEYGVDAAVIAALGA